MSLEDLPGWRQNAAQMSDEQIKEMLRLESNPWVQSSPVGAEQQPQFNDFAERLGVGGGYAFDPDALDEILAECQSLRDDIDKDAQHYEALAAVRPIAPDEYASKPVTERLSAFGQQQWKRNSGWVQYLDDFIAKLEATKRAYAEQEERGAGDVAAAGQEQA